MPNARAHDVITIVTGAALVPLAYRVFLDQGLSVEAGRVDTALLVGAHLLSGIMFSPDLDIDSAIDDRWGPLHWLWKPYMWLVPHGRFFSHSLILAPILRLLYFFLVTTLSFLGIAWALGRLGIIVPNYHLQAYTYLLHLQQTRPYEVAVVVIGFITGSAAHSIADWITTQRSHRRHI